MNMQGHFRTFEPSWSEVLRRWHFAGTIQDFVVEKVFNYSPALGILRGCRHHFSLCLFSVCLFSVEFNSSSLHSHHWKSPGLWFSAGWARWEDLKVKKAEPLPVKALWENTFLTTFASTKGGSITNQESSLESWGINVRLPWCLQNKLMSRQMRKMNCSVQV